VFPLDRPGGAEAALDRFVAEVTGAAAHHIGRGGNAEGASQIRAGYRALETLFEISPSSLAECDRVFAATTTGPAQAVHRAWRAQVRVISAIERLAADPGQRASEAVDLISRSLRDQPHNPIINSVAADVALLFEDSPLKAARHARLAVERGPCSPYARASLSQALAWLGETRQAHREALLALRLASALPNQSYWLMRCCVTAVRVGRFAEAMRHAELSHELAPNFKPPLRFLAALRFHHGDEARAAQALQRLKQLEPDFTLEMMGNKEYPATTLQKAGLLGVTASRLL
jgi:tetratricopeptide (TPR) repeat protein